MLVVGLTGGIGSGKSLCTTVFKMLGAPVFNSDLQARQLMETSPELKSQLQSAFGTSILMDNGFPDRKALAEIVFYDSRSLQLLNSIVHPFVFHEFDKWKSSLSNQIPYLIKEAAILFESGSDENTDFTVVIYSDPEVRIERSMKRDHATREQILARIARQVPDNEKIKRSDYVIYNDDDHSILNQICSLDKLFRNSGV